MALSGHLGFRFHNKSNEDDSMKKIVATLAAALVLTSGAAFADGEAGGSADSALGATGAAVGVGAAAIAVAVAASDSSDNATATSTVTATN